MREKGDKAARRNGFKVKQYEKNAAQQFTKADRIRVSRSLQKGNARATLRRLSSTVTTDRRDWCNGATDYLSACLTACSLSNKCIKADMVKINFERSATYPRLVRFQNYHMYNLLDNCYFSIYTCTINTILMEGSNESSKF